MKLKGDFFQIISTTTMHNGFTTIVRLNPNHIIFKGHFPGHPITPGVIQLQIIHELLEEYLGRKLKLSTISNCKFLNVLDPAKNSLFELECHFQNTGNYISAKTTGISGTITIIKLESVYAFS